MHFVFNQLKSAQAAAFIVQLAGGHLAYLKLIKLLYLADREALLRRGKPITGDQMVSMRHGPVLSDICDLIRYGHEEGKDEPWFQYLTEAQDYEIALVQEKFATDELSEFERNLLREIYEAYRNYSKWQIRDFTHTLPEYVDPKGSSLPIDPATILREAGWSDDDVRDVVASSLEERFFSVLPAVAS